MKISINSKEFQKTMGNIVNYSYGFLEGVEKGKALFLHKLGREVILALGQYIDINAKANPSALHHVYEWYRIGSPSARLFDIRHSITDNGIFITSTFKQSRTLSEDANVPFYNKAKIMEDGQPVVISPKGDNPLVFESGGERVFTKKSVNVRNPGGNEVQGSYERIFDEFMLIYFKQSFLRASGLYDYIKNPMTFKKNLNSGARSGKSKGISTGFSWIANARIGVE